MTDDKIRFFTRAAKIACGYWGPIVLAMGTIYHYCTVPAKNVKIYRYNDKLVHFATYTVLGFLFARVWYYYAARRKNRRRIAGVLICSAIAGLYGAIIEVRQIYCSRHFEWGDILANTLGALTGAVFYYLIQKGDYYGPEPCK